MVINARKQLRGLSKAKKVQQPALAILKPRLRQADSVPAWEPQERVPHRAVDHAALWVEAAAGGAELEAYIK